MDREIFLYRSALVSYEHECNSCDACHELHVENGDVLVNARTNPFQFPCCVDHLNYLRSNKLACPFHPFDYSERLSDKPGFYCEGCERVKNGLD